MSRNTATKSAGVKASGTRALENFVYAGSSALFLSIVHLYPDYWFFSFFALVPFLGALLRAGRNSPSALGTILAVCYMLVVNYVEVFSSPLLFFAKLAVLAGVFSLYGHILINVKHRIGLNVILIAILWLPLEYFLTHYLGWEDLFALSAQESSLLLRIGSLFGILMITFMIVIINTILLLIVRRVWQALTTHRYFSLKNVIRFLSFFKETLLPRGRHYFPDVRDPPEVGTT